MRVLLAWELGAGFGHIAPLRAIARELRERGHVCVFAMRHLEPAAASIAPELGPILQAPVRLHPGLHPVREQLSYTSLLYNCGFDSAAGLAARLRAWRDLIEISACDCVIADHSPTALLAARSLSLPSAVIGTGFSLPPMTTPFPSFRSDIAASPELLAGNEAAVLRIANAAVHATGGTAPLETLKDLFSGCCAGLFSYRELDCYPVHPGERSTPYRGLPIFSHGANLNWGERRERRIFAYLRPFPGLGALLQALYRIPAQVLVRIADANVADFASLRRDGFVIVDREVNMRRAAEDCDVFVNYGAHGTVAEMLLAGKPGLLIPNTRERELVTRSACALGAALAITADANANHGAALQQLIENEHLHSAARSFASRHAAQPREEILPGWCATFLEHVGAAPKGAGKRPHSGAGRIH